MKLLRRFYPLAAFLCGFVWDALTIGQRVRVVDLWRLGAFLFGAGLLLLWLASRESRKVLAPAGGKGWRAGLAELRWQAPNRLLQFFFGGIFSIFSSLSSASSSFTRPAEISLESSLTSATIPRWEEESGT